MNNSIIAIGTATAYNVSTGDIIFTSNSLQTSGLDLALSMDEVRGGMGNALQGYMPHTSGFTVNMEDSVFNMEYIAINCGGNITASADVMTTANITTTEINKITAPTVPVSMSGETKIYGWYKLPSDTTWTTIEFVGSDASVDGLAIGTEICLKYMHNNASAREFIITGSFVPSIVRLEMVWTLIATGSSNSGQTILGELQYEVPKFQFAGASSYSVSSSGTTTSPLSGSALINSTGTCNGGGFYAKVKEVIYNKGAFDNVKAIMIEGSLGGFDLEVSDTESLKVYAIYNDGTCPSILDNSLFTFTSKTVGVATVGSHTGLLTGVSAGTSTITVVATSKTSLETNCVVTVTA